ncbi:16S rRNA (guanine(966)-N(2))-methyltransferase RsmD [Mycetocola spongiae]|uniref:16S rRNA (guanine(966)-N(2))-methyltransferase RsmD n=1 Tax=Mycetocola spongiae TaxID=2859226 RepID=UPI001CF55474|nr:16S rRNA (guanine(966)-N(2))-methyltransferase RsmD [Mycetocola spongiae]UCR89156.1 16S rRNA (guanine(966)-N(2))-methyltransferase RsmD [Mycetocola spongiae]
MTRIVSGKAGSLTLKVPDAGTRPTSDRVREALFSALEARGYLEDAHVLDLFAGSGALGLESMSRGAASAVLVERAASAARVCTQNARALKAALKGPCDVRVAQRGALPFVQDGDETYDLVFIDPPYDLPEADLTALLDALPPRLMEDALVLVERSTRSPEPVWPARLERTASKKYGETMIWWAEPVRAE